MHPNEFLMNRAIPGVILAGKFLFCSIIRNDLQGFWVTIFMDDLKVQVVLPCMNNC